MGALSRWLLRDRAVCLRTGVARSRRGEGVRPRRQRLSDDLGTDIRFAIYAGLVALGGFIAASSVLAYNRVEPRSHALAVVAGATPVVAAVVVLPLVSPTLVTHPELSADLVAAYRAMVVLSQGSVWLLIAATFGWLQRRTPFESTTTEATQATP